MILAWFELQLFCDCDACADVRLEYGPLEPVRYRGRNWRAAVRLAWADSWRISRDRRRVFLAGHDVGEDTVGRLGGRYDIGLA